MRPRFTLKRLLAVTAAVAIVLFVWVQYPNVKAISCVAAINQSRSDPYELVDRPTGAAVFLNYNEATAKSATAELLKRTWSDIWHGRRRFVSILTWYTEGSKYDRQQTCVIRATTFGYQLEYWQEKSIPRSLKTN